MIKKNIQLCMIGYALMIGLSTELHGSQNNTSLNVSQNYLSLNSNNLANQNLNDSSRSNSPWLSGSARLSSFDTSSDTGSIMSNSSFDTISMNSDSNDVQDAQQTQQAQNIISQAFAEMDAWISNNSDNCKVDQATTFMNKALDNLGKAIGSVTMQPIKTVVTRAITFLSTETVVTKKGYMSNKILAGIVNGVKIAVTAPIKLAIRGGIILGGAYAGMAGGALAGLGAGIHQTATKLSELSDITDENGNISMQKIALLIPKAIITTLVGIVSTAGLTAYSVAEGDYVGINTGYNVGENLVGSRIFSLEPYQLTQADKDAAALAEQVAKQPEIDRINNLSSTALAREAMNKLFAQRFDRVGTINNDYSITIGDFTFTPTEQKDLLLGKSTAEIQAARTQVPVKSTPQQAAQNNTTRLPTMTEVNTEKNKVSSPASTQSSFSELQKPGKVIIVSPAGVAANQRQLFSQSQIQDAANYRGQRKAQQSQNPLEDAITEGETTSKTASNNSSAAVTTSQSMSNMNNIDEGISESKAKELALEAAQQAQQQSNNAGTEDESIGEYVMVKNEVAEKAKEAATLKEQEVEQQHDQDERV